MSQKWTVNLCDDCDKKASVEDHVMWKQYQGNVYCFHKYVSMKKSLELKSIPNTEEQIKQCKRRASISERQEISNLTGLLSRPKVAPTTHGV